MRGKFAGEGVSTVQECPDPPADTPDILSSSNKRKAGAGSVGVIVVQKMTHSIQ